tara:strand:+ start:1107 stop:2660 length:1554 start_codon:yes stop_codon:yes gene_type:complete
MINKLRRKSLEKINKSNSISDILYLNSQELPNKRFILNHTSDQIDDISYSQFNKYVNQCCMYFKKLKLKKKDIITLVLDNSLEYLIIYFASIRYGTILNPLPINLGNKIIDEKILEVQPKIIFTHFNIKKKNFKKHSSVIKIENYNFFKSKISKFREDEDFLLKTKKNDIALLYYSSGTTGKSKIIAYSNLATLENQRALIATKLISLKNIHLCFLPLYHTSSLRHTIKFSLCVGGSILLFKNFWSIKDNIWKLAEKYKANFFQTVPTILNVILNTKYKEYMRPKSLNFIGSGSAILPWQLKNKFEKKFGLKISNFYGLSEIGCSHFDDPFLKIKKKGQIGKILKGFKYKIFEKKDLSNRITKIGELGVKSKTLLTSYYNNRHLFKKSFKEGFFLTGDYVSINKKNIFFYIDRKKDLIIKGGVNILPSEIENIIQNIREIKEVAITSIYDEFYGENVCCFLVFKKKSKLSLKKIDNYCLRHLGNFKKPNKYIVLKKLPKGPSGKILKLVLKKKYEKK